MDSDSDLEIKNEIQIVQKIKVKKILLKKEIEKKEQKRQMLWNKLQLQRSRFAFINNLESMSDEMKADKDGPLSAVLKLGKKLGVPNKEK